MRQTTFFWLYLALAVVGLIWSWLYFVQHFIEAESILLGPFLKSAMATNASSGVVMDAYMAGVVFSLMVLTRAKADRVRYPWVYVCVCFLIGLCVAMPLYFAMQHRATLQPIDTGSQK